VAQQVTVGSLLLLAACAAVAERVHAKSLVVHPIPLMGFADVAAVAAVGLSGMVTDPTAAALLTRSRRRVFGVILMTALLAALTGVVANADGVAGPGWVLFFPLVVVSGAVLGATIGLGVGALAAAGIYIAAGISHTLDVAGVGELIVILPACPLFGWAAGGLAAMARDAAAVAIRQRFGLAGDVERLSGSLAVVAAGNLSRLPTLEQPATEETAQLAAGCAEMVKSLRKLVGDMSDVAGRIAGSADNLAHNAEQHVGTVEQQASAVAETTSTIEQLASTATSISSTALLVARYAENSRRDVDLGLASVEEVRTAMAMIRSRVAELGKRAGKLEDRVNRIGSTGRVIDELARRTTMLAVNASIEAARVGGRGDGFANVAWEIAELAAKARAATADITRIVTELEAEVELTRAVSSDGVAAVQAGLERQRDVDRALAIINKRVDDTAGAAERITHATRQQQEASDALVGAMERVEGTSLGATSSTRSHAAAALHLRDLMASLQDTVARFRLD
jgi:methyl-accepting chemotaxis protein